MNTKDGRRRWLGQITTNPLATVPLKRALAQTLVVVALTHAGNNGHAPQALDATDHHVYRP